MDWIYENEIRQFYQLVGQLWFKRIEAELWEFAQALDQWLHALFANPTPQWRESLAAFAAEQSAAGRTMTPESQADLEAFLESWADEVFATQEQAAVDALSAKIAEVDAKLADLRNVRGRASIAAKYRIEKLKTERGELITRRNHAIAAYENALDVANNGAEPVDYSIVESAAPESIAQNFWWGLGTGGKAVVNATASQAVSFGTLGFVDYDGPIAVTQWDLDSGYGTSNVIANASTGLAIGLVGGPLSKLGKVASYGYTAIDAAGNVVGVARSGVSIAQEGLNFANAAQLAGSAFGVFGNLAVAGKSVAAADTPSVDPATSKRIASVATADKPSVDPATSKRIAAIRDALSDANGKLLTKAERQGLKFTIRRVEAEEYLLDGGIKYRGNQGIDLAFTGTGKNEGRFALAEAKASSGLDSLKLDKDFIRQGSLKFFLTRLERAGRFDLHRELRASNYRSLRRLYEEWSLVQVRPG